MEKTIHINGKPVVVALSPEALHALQERTAPLLVEMELYFSCLIRKKTRFYDKGDGADQIQVMDGLSVRFRPVMTQSCSVSEVDGDEPPVTDFHINNPAAFVPRHLRIDYKRGEWCGEFGYERS